MIRNITIPITFTVALLFIASSWIPVIGQDENPVSKFQYSESKIEWISLSDLPKGKAPEVEVTFSDEKRTALSIEVPGLWMETVNDGSNEYSRLEIPGHATSLEVGMPEVPVVRVMVAVPHGAEIQTNCDHGPAKTLDGYTVYPFQEPTTDQVEEASPLFVDGNAYASETPYPMDRAIVTQPGEWRHLKVVILEVRPVAFVANRSELIVYPEMKVELAYTPSKNGAAFGYTPKPTTPEWERAFKGQIVNYNWLEQAQGTRSKSAGPEYLIIAHPQFAEGIKPLADWHYRAGITTEIYTVGTGDPQVIKNVIDDRYNQGNLDHVLLVGDNAFIPIYYWNNLISDHWYACLTGLPDPYPDVNIARLCAGTASILDNNVAKILKYIKDPPLDGWLENIVLVAHRENAPQKYVGCKETIRTSYIPQPHFNVDYYYGHQSSGTNTNVTAAISAGRGVVNYRGHGSSTSWSGWNYNGGSYKNSHINQITNGDWTPIVFNVACDCHRFTVSSMGEMWLNKYPGGAVASVGSTDASYTDVNHDYDKSLFDSFCNNGIYELGWIEQTATLHIITKWMSMGIKNAKMYTWFSDPAMKMWTETPSALNVSHNAQINLDLQTLNITVTSGGSPVSNATVCLYKELDLYEVQTTTGAGVASFFIDPKSAGNMYVTVTAQNYLPYEGDITVTGGVLSCNAYSISEATGAAISFTLDAGASNGNRKYVILGSLSGFEPGTALPGGSAVLPLNWDWFTDFVFSQANSALFVNFLGWLNANGQATAQFNCPPLPGYAGTLLHFAYCCNNPFNFASNPVTIKLVP